MIAFLKEEISTIKKKMRKVTFSSLDHIFETILGNN